MSDKNSEKSDHEDESSNNNEELNTEVNKSSENETSVNSDKEKLDINKIEKKNDHENDIDEESLEEIPMDDSEKIDEKKVVPSKLELNTENDSRNDTVVENKSQDISEKVLNIKKWGFNTFIRTKQKVLEKLSKTQRTVEIQLEDQIIEMKLQQTQLRMLVNIKREQIVKLEQQIISHQMTTRMYSDMSRGPDAYLRNMYLIEITRENSIIEHIKTLIIRINESCEALDTLIQKTIPDMMQTVQQFETSRTEYDGYKTEAVRALSLVQQEQLQQTQSTNNKTKSSVKLEELQLSLEDKKKKYEESKNILQLKLEMFEDNKKRVIERFLVSIDHAWFTYYSQSADLFSASQPNTPNSSNATFNQKLPLSPPVTTDKS